MKQFEYKLLNTLQTFNLNETLEKFGLEGWEAVGLCEVTPVNIKGFLAKKKELTILFKREIATH